MNVDRAVLTVAGSMVLLSLALAWLVSPYLYCGPVLRHPAELIQAANDRSVVTV